MILETRQLATVDEIEAIELKCRKHGCGGILRIDLKPGSISGDEQRPRCKRTWWTPSQQGTVLQLLNALTNNRYDEDGDSPIVTLILPSPTDERKQA